MRVISQDGTIDINYERYTIWCYKDRYLDIYHTACDCGETGYRRLADYSSKEKAIKAMEKLREQYKRLETLKLYTKGSREDIREILTLDELGCTILKTRKLSVFQFPQDDEIEV